MQRRSLITLMFAAAVLLAAGDLPVCAEPATGGKPLTIFAAASLKNVLDETCRAIEAAGGLKPVVVLAASSALAWQLEQGAPADMFISADDDWMTYVAGKGLIRAQTRTGVATNTLVLIAPADSTVSADLSPGVDLAGLLGEGRLAIASVAAVPAGKYGKAALEYLGAWAGVAGKLAQTDNVRGALMLVARREAPLGIVYRSDAKADTRVRVVAEFPAASHAPIVYQAAVTTTSSSPGDAVAFLSRLTSPSGRAVFTSQGFGIPE